jgi:antirestriction protein ArdC
MSKVHETITNKIIEELEKGNIPWRKPWKGSENNPKNLISGKAYSGINFFLLSMSCFESNYFLTFNQAKNLGGSVMKGQKGLPIIFYGVGKSKDTLEGEKPKGFSFLKSYTVFNIAQCENLDHSRIEEAKTFEPLEFNPIEEAEAIVNNFKGKPKITSIENSAYYRPITDTVNMPNKDNFLGIDEYYATLFHELTHSTGAKKRLSRPEVTDQHFFGSSDYSKEELTAELGSAFLCSQAGIDNTLKNSVGYLQSWLKVLKSKDNSKWIIEASSKAQKATNYINGITKPVAV